jgi:hypothetical protein
VAGAVVALVAIVVGVVPVPGGAIETGLGRAEAQTPAYTQGTTPIADALAQADQYRCEDLTRDELAAMVLVPSYTETGATGSVAPSPMTLSRYDNQSALHAFKSPGSADKAFFHPGVGMWQFDSAGGWNLTGATAISTWTAAGAAAQMLASRYCASTSSTKAGKRAYAWAAWYYCGNTSRCETVFTRLYQGGQLVVGSDPAVGREGGMVYRTCEVSGIGTVPCGYVDPAKAEGLSSWTAPGYGPAPLTAPFYVFEANGREYRYWLKADTGYAQTIRAHKPVTSDARTSLTWAYSDTLCDRSANRGTCAVAAGPWSPWGALGFATFGRAVIGANVDGRLEAFAVAWNGLLYRSTQTTPNGAFGAWSALGSGFSNAAVPVVTRNADGRMEVFATGADGGLWHAWQTTVGSSWSNVFPLYGSMAGPPAVGINADGRLQVFARAPDGSVRTSWQWGAGGLWVPWQNMGGVIPATTTPVVAQNADGRAQLFVLGTDRAVYSSWQTARNGGWTGWTYFGGPWTSPGVSVARNADGRLELFTLGANGALWRTAQGAPGATVGTWTSLGGSWQSQPMVLTDRSGRLNVVVPARSDGAPTQLRQQSANGVFASPVRIGGASTLPVDLGLQGDGRLAALVTGTDRFLYLSSTTSSLG